MAQKFHNNFHLFSLADLAGDSNVQRANERIKGNYMRFVLAFASNVGSTGTLVAMKSSLELG